MYKLAEDELEFLIKASADLISKWEMFEEHVSEKSDGIARRVYEIHATLHHIKTCNIVDGQ